MKMRRKSISFQTGHEKQYVANFEQTSLMEEKALSFLGTRNTDQFTKKHYCITLTPARKDRSLYINPNQKVKHTAFTSQPPQRSSRRYGYACKTCEEVLDVLFSRNFPLIFGLDILLLHLIFLFVIIFSYNCKSTLKVVVVVVDSMFAMSYQNENIIIEWGVGKTDAHKIASK